MSAAVSPPSRSIATLPLNSHPCGAGRRIRAHPDSAEGNGVAAATDTTSLLTRWGSTVDDGQATPNRRGTIPEPCLPREALRARVQVFTSPPEINMNCSLLVRLVIAALALVCGSSVASAQLSTSRDPNAVGVDGTVRYFAERHGRIYLSGGVQAVGTQTAPFVELDLATGSRLASLPVPNGEVHAMVSDGAGGWFIGGTFTAVGSVPRSYLAHLLADGTVDPGWNPEPSLTVRALALTNGTLYVGGEFGGMGTGLRSRLAAVDAATGQVLGWNPGANGTVHGLTVNGDVVYAVGEFTAVAGSTRLRAAAISRTSGSVTGWLADASASVFCVAVRDGTVWIGGSFSTVNGTARSKVAGISELGGLSSVQPEAFGNVSSLAVSDDIVFVAWSGPMRATRISTGQPLSWNLTVTSSSVVHSFAINGTTLYVAGTFTTFAGQNRSGLAAVDLNSGMLTPWSPNVNGSVEVLSESAGRLAALGHFGLISLVARPGVGAIDAFTGELTSWMPQGAGAGGAIAVDDFAVYLFMQRFPGPAVVAAFSAADGSQLWETAVTGSNGGATQVDAMAVKDGSLYIAGNFLAVTGFARNGLALLDAGTGALSLTWTPSPGSGSARGLCVFGNTLYVAGAFTTIAGFERPGLAAFDATTGILSAWTPSPTPPGGFTSISASAEAVCANQANVLHMYSAAASATRLWTRQVNEGNTAVWYTLLGDTLLTGANWSIGGQYRGGLALDVFTNQDRDWIPEGSTGTRCWAWLPMSGRIYVGGEFSDGLLPYRGPVTGLGVYQCPTPASPVDLVATQGATGIDLSWGAGLGLPADHFTIWRTEGSCGQPLPLVRLNSASTTFTDTSATIGQQYSYKVLAAASDSICLSEFSNCETITVEGQVDMSIELAAALLPVDASGSFTVTASNLGSASSSGAIDVTVMLPSTVTYLGSAGAGWQLTVDGSSVHAAYSGVLNPGTSAAFDISVQASCAALPTSDVLAVVDTVGDTNSVNDLVVVSVPAADITSPTVVCPMPITVAADAECLGTVPTVTSLMDVSDNCTPLGSIVRLQSPAAGTTLALGVHPVTVSATDSSGNSASCVVDLIVTDTAPPVLGCPSNLAITAPIGVSAAAVNYVFTVDEACSGAITIGSTNPPGTVFPLGSTSVTLTATDVSGNTASCNFDVFVRAGQPGSGTAGIYQPASGAWFLRNLNSSGAADIVFSYGPGGLGWMPVTGDWNGDGVDSPGLYDPQSGVFFLKNSSGPGAADLVFGFGPAAAGWKPLVGDWNGDGLDTVGLYSPTTGVFFLKNTNTVGGADIVVGYGPANLGWEPLVGDWDGNGVDTVGLYRPSDGFFFLKNSNTPGGADLVFSFGPGGLGWRPVISDWNGDDADSIGIYSPSNGFFFLRNSNTPGAANLVFGYGPGGATITPVVGDWNGL